MTAAAPGPGAMIDLRDVRKRFGAVDVVHGIDL